MRSRFVVLGFVACALAVALFRPAGRVGAHPLGNFTVNHYTRIDVADSGIVLYRVLDMAEIPALQERQRIDTDDDGTVSDAEAAAYAMAKVRDLQSGLELTMNGEPVALDEESSELAFPEGQGGLSLLRLEVTYRADLPSGWRASTPMVEFADTNDPDRVGWREVVVRGGPGIELTESTAPAIDLSHELTAYPKDSLSSPPEVRSASFAFTPGAGEPLPAAHPKETAAVRGNPDGALRGFTDLLAKDDLSAGVIALALLTAVVFGAYHALTPGHGKTVVAAYLIGSRGTARHALLLGLVVTATHTSTVYLVGFVALYLSQYILPEDLYPWLGLASGGLILAMGLSLLVARLRSSGIAGSAFAYVRQRLWPLFSPRPRLVLAPETAVAAMQTPDRGHHVEEHAHPHGAHTHHAAHHDEDSHDAMAPHRHGIGLAHSHRIPGQDGEPLTLRSLIGLGIFGGMVPCPSAIVVMLGAIALHRVAFGLLLIVAFSLGLAAVLVAIGFALVYAQAITRRVPLLGALGARTGGRCVAIAVRLIPIAGSMAVVGAGLAITLRALAQQGVL